MECLEVVVERSPVELNSLVDIQIFPVPLGVIKLWGKSFIWQNMVVRVASCSFDTAFVVFLYALEGLVFCLVVVLGPVDGLQDGHCRFGRVLCSWLVHKSDDKRRGAEEESDQRIIFFDDSGPFGQAAFDAAPLHASGHALHFGEEGDLNRRTIVVVVVAAAVNMESHDDKD